jgi:hypothetical protein
MSLVAAFQTGRIWMLRGWIGSAAHTRRSADEAMPQAARPGVLGLA